MIPHEITRVGQPAYMEPVVAHPVHVSSIERSLAQAFGRQLPGPVVLRHEEVKLRWMKPDGNGGLVPR